MTVSPNVPKEVLFYVVIPVFPFHLHFLSDVFILKGYFFIISYIKILWARFDNCLYPVPTVVLCGSGKEHVEGTKFSL